MASLATRRRHSVADPSTNPLAARQTHLRRIQTPTAALLSCLDQSAQFTPPHHTKAQTPIAEPTKLAGSYMGGFRTQALETLHLPSRSARKFCFPRADRLLSIPVGSWARLIAMKRLCHKFFLSAGRAQKAPRSSIRLGK